MNPCIPVAVFGDILPRLGTMVDALPDPVERVDWQEQLGELHAWHESRLLALSRQVFTLSGANDGLDGLIELLRQSDEQAVPAHQLCGLLELLQVQLQQVCERMTVMVVEG